MRTVFERFRVVFGIAAILLLLLGGFALQLLSSAGQFKTLEPHFAGACTKVAGLPGPEDIVIHPRTGIAYISTTDRRSVLSGGPGRGALFAYDLRAESPRPQNLTPNADDDFHPHGVSLYLGDDGRDVLYVINHGGGSHKIEIYDLVGSELVHRRTLSDPLLVTPNDLVAVGHDRLYVTNDHANQAGFSRLIEDYFRRSISTVVYYDGERFVEAASGMGYPNGIAVGLDGRTLFVGSITDASVIVFGINPKSGALKQRGEIPIGSGVDNLDIDASGDLWIGAHAKLLTFVEHAGDASLLAPSQIIRVSGAETDSPVVEEIFLSLGEDLSGSSVGATHGDRLLIGAVFDDHILDCRMLD